jgi:hypothetical protein
MTLLAPGSIIAPLVLASLIDDYLLDLLTTKYLLLHI